MTMLDHHQGGVFLRISVEKQKAFFSDFFTSKISPFVQHDFWERFDGIYGWQQAKINSKTAASLFYGHVCARCEGSSIVSRPNDPFLHKEPERTNVRTRRALEFSTTLLNERPFCWNLK